MSSESQPARAIGSKKCSADDSSRPLVSAVIPTYNSANTLRRAIDSVLSQNYSALELIVVDDASSDETHEVVEALRDPRLRYIKLAQNGGVSNARNKGVEAAQGEFIAFLDADDAWLPGKIKSQMAEATSRDGITLVFCAAHDVSPSGEVVGVNNFGRVPVSGARAWVALLEYAYIITSTALIPKACFERVGGFNPELRVAEDQDLWIRLALLGEVAFVNEVFVIKHLVLSSLSIGGRPDDDLTYLLPMLMRHLEAVEADLSKKEMRTILRNRLGRIGRNLYARGLVWQGLKFIGKAILRGDSLKVNIRYVVINTPPGRALRKILKKMKK